MGEEKATIIESPDITAMKRNFEARLMAAIMRVGQEAVASAIGKGQPMVSAIVAGDRGIKLKDLWSFLDVLGYKVVPKEQMTVDREVMEAYRVIVNRAVTNPSALAGGELE